MSLYYYQQFSYEVQSGFGTATYLDQLKKAVHPAGWAPFGKVKVASSISAAVVAAGSSLGGGWFTDLGVTAPADQFSPILASTFDILFSEVTKRRLGVVDILDGAFEEHIILEDSEDLKVEGDSIILDASEIFEVAISCPNDSNLFINSFLFPENDTVPWPLVSLKYKMPL